MAGRTGYTPITNASAMQGPAQITAVYEHFDSKVGEVVASASALPVSGNWTNRTIMASDTGVIYAWRTSWVPITAEPWIAPTLAGGTTNAPGRNPVRYRRIPGMIQLEGCVNATSAAGYSIFTLPAGYTPAAELRIWADQGGLQILPGGLVSSTQLGTKSNLTFSGQFAVA